MNGGPGVVVQGRGVRCWCVCARVSALVVVPPRVFVRVDEDEAVMGSDPSSPGRFRAGPGKRVGCAEAGPVVCVAGVFQCDGWPRRTVGVLFKFVQ